MAVYINGVEKSSSNTPEGIRDALLSLPDGERKFVLTNPGTGESKVISIVKDETTDEVVSVSIEQ